MLNKILNQMSWRKAVKSFDLDKKLTEDQVDCLVETARLAPTSYGLQPVKLYVVSDDEVKLQLFEAGYKQPQFSTASHVFVLTARTEISQEDVDEQIRRTSNQQSVEEDSLSIYRQALENNLMKLPEEKAHNWAARQAYILLGMMMSTATQINIDVSPMEGFSKEKVDKIIGCSQEGYKSVVVLAAGFRDEKDSYLERPKVRKTKDEFVKYI